MVYVSALVVVANALAAICCGGRLTNTMLGCLRPRLPRNCISAENYLRKRFCPSKSMLKFLFITNHFEAESVVFKSDGVTCCYANHLDWRSNLWIHGQPTKSPELLYCSWNISNLCEVPHLCLGAHFARWAMMRLVDGQVNQSDQVVFLVYGFLCVATAVQQ